MILLQTEITTSSWYSMEVLKLPMFDSVGIVWDKITTRFEKVGFLFTIQ